MITEGNFRDFYESHKDYEGEFKLEIKEFRDKRTFNQNAYLHVLIGKIAEKLRTSDAEVKNFLLSRYGQLDLNDGKPVEMMIRDDVPTEKIEEIHLRPTSYVEFIDGKAYRRHLVIRGSHTYNTREFCRVIDGAISEARECGIPEAEIMTPGEKEKLAQLAKNAGIKIDGVSPDKP